MALTTSNSKCPLDPKLSVSTSLIHPNHSHRPFAVAVCIGRLVAIFVRGRVVTRGRMLDGFDFHLSTELLHYAFQPPQPL
jgi:hypothetical protein